MSRMPRGCEITLQGLNKDIGSVSAAEVHESSGKGGCNHKPAKIWTDWAVSSYCAPLARAWREAARTGGADATAAKASLGIQRQAVSAPRISLIAAPASRTKTGCAARPAGFDQGLVSFADDGAC